MQLEAFKGDQYRLPDRKAAPRTGQRSYDFPAVKDGRCIKEEITLKQVEGMQSCAFNTRRGKFQDARVRQAFNYAFDFEWANTNLFYGQYKRSRSYFNNSEMEATGLPSPEELAILEPLKDQLPAEVFTTEYANPVNANARIGGRTCGRLAKLLNEAGWNVTQDGNKSVLKNAKGETIRPSSSCSIPRCSSALRCPTSNSSNCWASTVGHQDRRFSANIKRRVETFDFDIIVGNFGQSLSPGNEQREFWGSAAAKRNGSRNLIGISDPAIDSSIDAIIFAKNRAGARCRLQGAGPGAVWNHFVVPMWFIALRAHRRGGTALAAPETLPDYALGFPTIWWWDEEKAKKVKTGMRRVAAALLAVLALFAARSMRRPRMAFRFLAT